MNELLANILEAHGGLDRWNKYQKVEATIVMANGVRLPTKRRAYTRGPDRQPILDILMVSIDISEVVFTRKGRAR